MSSQPNKDTTPKHYIDGHWVEAQGILLTSTNPVDNTIVYRCAHATETDVTDACFSAHRALAKWAQLDVAERIHYTQQFAQHIEKNRRELTELISRETGKPLWEAATEVSAVIGKVTLSKDAYFERTSDKTTVGPDANSHLRYKPHGVVAVLGPFNFPAHLSNGHIIPAILAGNTVVYKPSELVPGVAALVMQCWHDSGLPAGVINCIQGGANTAVSLLEQDIQGVYFTGSYNTGVKINTLFCARPDVILALEMGGNNPLIIDDVQNNKAAVYHTILSSFITAGQRCTSARRVLIADTPLGDDFLKQLISASKRLRVGAYTQTPEPFMGPVISHKHALEHLSAKQGLIAAGGHELLPMTLLADQTGLLSPGIIDMSEVSTPSDDEIFAPLIQIYRYRNFEHALDLANQTRYGLAAGLFSDDEQHYQQFYQTMRAGLINWNRPTTGASSGLPFGGIGRSGNHRPSAYFAADYCAYPIASLEQPILTLPTELIPGISFEMDSRT